MHFTENGGELTLYMTGKLSRPSTEPLYSGGDRTSFPVPFDYNKVEYTSFVKSHLKNSENVLLWQQISQERFTAIFGASELHSPVAPTAWIKATSYQSLKKMIQENQSSGKNVYSLAFDGTNSDHYAAYLMEGYGSAQSLLEYTDYASGRLDEGKRITSCTADHSQFYIVMTKDAPGYESRNGQSLYTRSSWSEIAAEIRIGYPEHHGITDLCYCSGRGQYLLVLTEGSPRQCCSWFCLEDAEKKKAWMKGKQIEGYHPTIMFQDPTDNKELVVMTKDPNRSNYLTRSRYPLKTNNATATSLILPMIPVQ